MKANKIVSILLIVVIITSFIVPQPNAFLKETNTCEQDHDIAHTQVYHAAKENLIERAVNWLFYPNIAYSLSCSHNIVGATCTQPVRCTKCGFSPGGSPLGHSFGSWTTVTTGNCKTYGSQKRTCSRCGTSETRSVSGSHNIVSATCTQPVRCTICGYSPGGTALGHSFGSWTTVTTGNCKTYGSEKRTCSKCGTSETRSVTGSHNIVGATCTQPVRCTICGYSPGGSALGHSFGSWTTVTAGNCKTYGTQKRTCSRCSTSETNSVLGSHNIVGATCTEPVRCTICGYSPGGSTLGHSFGSWTTVTTGNCKTYGTQKRTCSRCGTSETSSVLGSHNIVSATCTEPVRCTICGFSPGGTALGHSFGSWTTMTTGDCKTYGTQKRTCSRCGTSETNSVLGSHNIVSATCTEPVRCTICGFSPGGTALGHSFGSWTTVTTGNCTTYGKEKRTCSKCGASETSSVLGSHNIVGATCTEPVKCTICGFSPGGTALGHSFGSWTTVTTGNCKTDGTEKRACSRCNSTENRSVTGSHDIVPATCTEPVRCTICGFSPGGTALGHSFGSWSTVTTGNCKTDGTEKRACSRCNATENRSVAGSHDIVPATCTEPVRCTICEFSIGAPIPHSVNKWTITKNATCITTGVQTGECVNCKITIVQDIPKSQHNYILGNWQLTSLESECRRRLGVCDICQDEKVEHDNDHTYNSDGKCIDCSYKGTGEDEFVDNEVFSQYDPDDAVRITKEYVVNEMVKDGDLAYNVMYVGVMIKGTDLETELMKDENKFYEFCYNYGRVRMQLENEYDELIMKPVTIALITGLIGNLIPKTPKNLGSYEGTYKIPFKFGSIEKAEAHFAKHGGEFKGAFSNVDEYVQGAKNVINNGIKVTYKYNGETRIGYVKFMGNTSKGVSKFEFVGTNSVGDITTYHVESGKDFWKMLNGSNSQIINPVP
ncbi:MAG TPA: hypothetical protein VIO64_07160 [Pseudobacteroides sp.]|uniref:hypothetical protein n=1 Tax=Pseudobacteroides sp. TaxID=1968840 RepID=UPI002F959BA3